MIRSFSFSKFSCPTPQNIDSVTKKGSHGMLLVGVGVGRIASLSFCGFNGLALVG